MSKRDYYEILGVARGASDADLKAAFRKLAMQHHPDRNPGDRECEHRFKECNEAYEVLRDPDKRAAYDRFGHAAFEHGGGGHGFSADFGSTFSEIFEDLFGMGGGRRGRSSGRVRGDDLRYNMEITLEETYRRQDRANPHPHAGGLRSLLRHRRQGRHASEGLRHLQRPWQDQARAGLLHARAHMSDLSRPRAGDRESLHILRRLRSRDA